METIAVDCLIWEMMAAATIVVSGLSFFFSSAVMDLVPEEADVDAVVEIISANLAIQTKKMAGFPPFFMIILLIMFLFYLVPAPSKNLVSNIYQYHNPLEFFLFLHILRLSQKHCSHL